VERWWGRRPPHRGRRAIAAANGAPRLGSWTLAVIGQRSPRAFYQFDSRPYLPCGSGSSQGGAVPTLPRVKTTRFLSGMARQSFRVGRRYLCSRGRPAICWSHGPAGPAAYRPVLVPLTTASHGPFFTVAPACPYLYRRASAERVRSRTCIEESPLLIGWGENLSAAGRLCRADRV
jgi:hypothetical protein